MKRALAIAVLCTVLLTGCGRAAKRAAQPPAPVPATTAVTTDNGVGSGGTGKTATGTGGTNGTGGSAADGQIATTDGLLSQLDGQVDADAQPAQDAD
jgi:hypothetical protein